LRDLVGASWIVPPAGSVLRHRWDLMFQEQGFETPRDLIESAALLFVTRMLRQTDFVTVVATDVANYYATHGVAAILDTELPCKMDAFGLITRADRPASPAAEVMLRAIRCAALQTYGVALSGAARTPLPPPDSAKMARHSSPQR
jgi:DNA-binding transcriptional LysR family regulator